MRPPTALADRSNGYGPVDLYRLAVFNTLVDEGTMSKAGDRLFISQPAVSAHIKALEGALGMQLFDRIGRRSVVNYAGRLLYRNAERLFSAADDLAEAMEDLRGTSSGTLRLGMSHVSQYWLSPTLASFKKAYPNVGLSASVANSGQLERMVLDRTLDIAIIAQTARRAEIKSLAVAADRLVPVCPPGHAEAGPHEAGTAVLKGETLVIREAGSASRAAFDDLAEKAGLDVLASVELGSEEAIRQVVASGHGVGMVSERGASCDLTSGRLDLIDDPALCAPIGIHVVHHGARVLTPAQRAFLDTLEPIPAVAGEVAAAD